MMTLNSPMMSTWLFVLGALLLAVLLSVVIIWPWLRQRIELQPTAHAADDALLTQNVALFKQRLAELDADFARGEVDDESFNLQKVELQRQLLAATADVKLAQTGKAPISKTSVLAMLVWPSLLMLMGYLMIGDRRQVFEYWQAKDRYDGLANELLSGALSEPPQSFYADEDVDKTSANIDAKSNTKSNANTSLADKQQRMVKRTQQLIQAMQSETHARADDATYWLNMSQAYMALQETPSALESLARAQRLAPENDDIAMTYAQVSFFSAGGQLNADTRSILQQVLKKSPYHEGAQMLMAMGEVKAENLPQAEYWINRLKRTLIDKGGERTDAIASLNQLIQVIADKKRMLADAMTVKVSVVPAMHSQLAPDATLFVVAKSAEGGAPFAVKRLPVAQLLASEGKSISVKLTDNDAMLPSRTLSTAKRDKIPLFFTARISQSGNAIAQQGDLASAMMPSTEKAPRVDVVIDRPYQPTS